MLKGTAAGKAAKALLNSYKAMGTDLSGVPPVPNYALVCLPKHMVYENMLDVLGKWDGSQLLRHLPSNQGELRCCRHTHILVACRCYSYVAVFLHCA